MKLTITDEAANKLRPFFEDQNALILLDFDDGVPFRVPDGTSTAGTVPPKIADRKSVV